MKKLALLLSVAILAACGGGGSSSNSLSNSQGGQPGGTSATLSLSFQKSTGKTILNSYSGISSKTWRRVIVTNPGIVNSAGQMVQFTLPDFDANTGSIAIDNIPVGPGYRLDIVDYRKDTQVFSAYTAVPAPVFRGYSQTNHVATTLDPSVIPTWTRVYTYPPTYNVSRSTNLLKPYKIVGYYGKTFTMLAGGTTLTGIDVQAPQATVSLPTLFHGGIPSSANLSYMNLSTQYKLKVKLSGMNPFDTSKWTLRQAYLFRNITTLGTGTKYNMSGFANLSSVYTPILIGPSPYDAVNNNSFTQTYASIADFNLNGSLLKDSEKSTDFYFKTPYLDSILFTRRGGVTQ